ncbi:hypothetical protein M3N64_08495 [Sporolactobacillus sp. CPB3-1]|uniref:Uncharacterized protein n=1 Tax=Sporolactobacillus mangiferae TaxID=2940498 RepID=A0ABT0MAU7_9BACL|nr:hypothetical protein [Sporolactobacillus mangiferae]MCL1631986.1 hypothetical protein [Sporolactobacillus mangiferae]
MFETLIPFYREKESYTLFYDANQKQMYRLPHRNKGNVRYYFLGLAVLYGSYALNALYQNISGIVSNLISFIVILAGSFLVAKFFYKNYYVQNRSRNIFITNTDLLNYAAQGKKQFHREFFVSLFIFLASVTGSLFFFMFSRLLLLIVSGLGYLVFWMLMIMKPFSRMQLYKRIERGEID